MGDMVYDDLNVRLRSLAFNLRALVAQARYHFKCPKIIEDDDVLYSALMPVEKATRGMHVGGRSWNRVSTTIVRRRCIDLIRSWSHRSEKRFREAEGVAATRTREYNLTRWDPVAAAETNDEIDYLSRSIGVGEEFTALLRDAVASGHILDSTFVARKTNCRVGAARARLVSLRRVARARYENVPPVACGFA